MGSPAEKHEDASLIESVVDVLEAGQRVLLDRLELLSVEARLLISSSVASLVLLLGGLALLLVGWVAANVFVILTLAPYWNHAQATALVAGVNLAFGVIALMIARRRAASGVQGEPARVAPDTHGTQGGSVA